MDSVHLPPGARTLKYDTDKPRYELIPVEPLDGVARVLAFGAEKYAADNWRKHGGIEWTRVFGSILRHAWAWLRGEDNDPESGLPHLDHLAAQVLFLSYYTKKGIGTDDRFKVGGQSNDF